MPEAKLRLMSKNRNDQERPWGRYKILHKEGNVQVKRIEIKPHLRLSLQKHLRRSEKWVVISGKGLATLGKKEFPVQSGSFLDVPKGEIHRMQNTGDRPLVFAELQFGDYLEEDDIIRFEDDFGRS